MEDYRLLIALTVSAVYIGGTMLNAPVIGQKYYLVLLTNSRHYLVPIVLAVLLTGFGIWRGKVPSMTSFIWHLYFFCSCSKC